MEATEEHHVYPIHLGGPVDGIKKPLCGNCHTFAHQTSDKLYKGKALDARLDRWYNSYQEARKIVQIIVRAQISAESLNMDDSLVPIMFKIPRSLRDKMHVRKIDKNHTSIVKYLVSLIVKDLGGTTDDVDSILNTIRES